MDTVYVHDILVGEDLEINFQLSENSVPISGAMVSGVIQRLVDDNYWTGSAWQAAVPDPLVTLTPYDSTNYPGYFTYSLTPAASADIIIATIIYSDGTNDNYETHYWNIRENPAKAVIDKLPSKLYLAGTTNPDGDSEADQVTGGMNAEQKVEMNKAFQILAGLLDPSKSRIVYLD